MRLSERTNQADDGGTLVDQFGPAPPPGPQRTYTPCLFKGCDCLTNSIQFNSLHFYLQSVFDNKTSSGKLSRRAHEHLN